MKIDYRNTRKLIIGIFKQYPNAHLAPYVNQSIINQLTIYDPLLLSDYLALSYDTTLSKNVITAARIIEYCLDNNYLNRDMIINLYLNKNVKYNDFDYHISVIYSLIGKCINNKKIEKHFSTKLRADEYRPT